MEIKVCIEESIIFKKAIVYLLKLIEKNYTVKIILDPAGLKIGSSSEADLHISDFFTNDVTPRAFNDYSFSATGYIETKKKEPDYFATAFYLLNSLQEYDATNLDSLERFKYSASCQARLSNVTDNVVQSCFAEIARQLGVPPKETPTQFFLSHDIDTVYEAILQDGFYALKKGRIDIFFQLLFRAAMGRPDWLNMDLIMDIESEYDCRSTFFWIVNKGKAGNKLANADYAFKSKNIQRIVNQVDRRGFENGLHKSISADSFSNELSQFSNTPIANRYHYLKFNIPSGYDTLEASGLKLDASLGFAETPGFRNNYGLPFNPFNLKDQRPYAFVEVPLNVMDTSFFRYKRSSVTEAEKEIFSFFEKNKTNCVLSVLWHNNFFSNYKYCGYLPLYKKILQYIQENQLKTITQQQIVDNYSITWP
jgi:hypothetical protein